MPIEFRCTQCQKLLRTPDDTAGKQAKCPECGTVMTIPSPQTPPLDAAAPGSPLNGGAGGAGVPPGPGAAPGSPFGQPQGVPGETGNPYQSPAHYDYGPTPGAIPGFAPAGAIQPTRIDMGGIFSRNWEVFKQQWAMCLAGWFVAFGINLATGLAFGFAEGALRVGMKNSAEPLVVVLTLAHMLINLWVSIGLGLFTLRLARGEQAVFADFFAGGPYLLRVVGAGILYGLICFVGFLLLIVPGIIFMLMFSQFYYLILDRNLPVTDSLTMSRELTKGNKLTFWAVWLVAVVLGVLAIALTCGVGALAVVPYWMLLHPVIYLAMSGQPSTGQLRYGPPPVA